MSYSSIGPNVSEKIVKADPQFLKIFYIFDELDRKYFVKL